MIVQLVQVLKEFVRDVSEKSQQGATQVCSPTFPFSRLLRLATGPTAATIIIVVVTGADRL